MIATRGQIENLVMRIQDAFLEYPMLSLSLSDAHRRFGLEETTSAGVLGALAEAHVLTLRDGVYRRYFPRRVVRVAA